MCIAEHTDPERCTDCQACYGPVDPQTEYCDHCGNEILGDCVELPDGFRYCDDCFTINGTQTINAVVRIENEKLKTQTLQLTRDLTMEVDNRIEIEHELFDARCKLGEAEALIEEMKKAARQRDPEATASTFHKDYTTTPEEVAS